MNTPTPAERRATYARNKRRWARAMRNARLNARAERRVRLLPCTRHDAAPMRGELRADMRKRRNAIKRLRKLTAALPAAPRTAEVRSRRALRLRERPARRLLADATLAQRKAPGYVGERPTGAAPRAWRSSLSGQASYAPTQPGHGPSTEGNAS